MLWEKDEDGLYVDLLHNIEYQRKNYPVHRRKNDAISIKLRWEGNRHYSGGDFERALAKYNESACMAVNNSECLGLAYANRSQCFLKLHLYERCLVKIQMAREFGYPADLFPKLNNRKTECLNNLKTKKIENVDVKLEEMVGPFEIEMNKKFGRLAKAVRDIEIGETILIEKTYLRTVNSDESNSCSNCGVKRMNFIPCINCADVMYCSAECAKNNYHQSECDMIIGTIENKEYLGFIIRSVVIAINNFSNITEMIEFVENCLSNDVIPSHPQTSKTKYFHFLKLAMPCKSQLSRYLEETCFIFHGIVLRANSFEYEEGDEIIHELSLQTSIFNHSCLPNIAKLSRGNLSVCKSILRISKGDQLFLTYLQGEPFHMTEKGRNDQLEKKYEFRCNCALCTEGTLAAVGLDNDPCFKFVVSMAKEVDNIDIDVVKEKCIQFLYKFSQYYGSQEISYIADVLSVMFSKELNK